MTDATDDPHPRLKSDAPIILVAVGIFGALSAWMAVASAGFLEADGVTHYLARRFALEQPLHLVGVWTRPLCVFLYAVPAQFGLVATRLTSLALVMIMLAVTLSASRRQTVARPAIVALFLLTQPLLFAHSFAELTEIPFALLLIGGFWAYQRKQFWLLALIAAISPLARPEGFGLILVVAIALILHKRWWWLALLPIGLIAWSWVGWSVHGRPGDYAWYRWLVVNWPYSQQSVYGSGSVFRFVLILPAVVGPMAFPLVWVGAWLCLRIRRIQDHDIRCRMLIAIIPIGILLGHTTLWMLGKMASSGEPRYMLIAAPFWAMLAAAGWEWVCARLKISKPTRWLTLAAILPVAANIVHPVFPLAPTDNAVLARQVVTWMRDHPEVRPAQTRLAAASPYLFLELDLDRLDRSQVVEPSARMVVDPPGDVTFVWDSYFSDRNSDASLVVTEDLLRANGWTAIASFEQGPRRSTLYAGPTAPRERRINPPAS